MVILFSCLCLFFLYRCDVKEKQTTDSTLFSQDQDSIEVMPPIIAVPPKVIIDKELLYDQHTLEDIYPYRDTTRCFQWDKIEAQLNLLEKIQFEKAQWGVLQNRRNVNGEAPLARKCTRNAYQNMEDPYGVERYQSIPLYLTNDLSMPERYGRDGALIKIIREADTSGFLLIENVFICGEWLVPAKYVKYIPDTVVYFSKTIFVDRSNQNIVTLEKAEEKWWVRSMNPVTTGLRNPPYQHETPLGIFVFQEKKVKMYYYVDGTTNIAGYSPYASRFCNGGYIHGVPVNLPRKNIIEFSSSLGTTPRSHMCVRNASSHAQFIYDWGPVEQTLVFVIE